MGRYLVVIATCSSMQDATKLGPFDMFVINQRQLEVKMVTRLVLVSITYLSCALVACHSSTKLVAADQKVEPPFPSPFNQVGPNEKVSVKLVSEILDSEFGYHTSLEYLDLELARAAYVNKYKSGQETVLLVAKQDTSYTYKPYTCKTAPQNAVTLPELKGWSTDLSVTYHNQEGNSASCTLRIFGILGLWLYATTQPKVYSNSQIVYSVSKNLHKVSHQWCTNDSDRKLKICFYFINTSPAGKEANPSELTLEMVQVSSAGDGKAISTFNIVTLDYELDQDAYDNVLQVPVGYGCLAGMDENEFDEKLKAKGNEQMPNMSPKNHKLSLEITATKFVDSPDQAVSRSSSTIFGELVQSTLGYYSIRLRDTGKDLKHIIDTTSRLNYFIDLRTGGCEISAFNSDTDLNGDISIDAVFSNQMRLNLTPDIMKLLFDVREGFRLIKTIKQSLLQDEVMFFEKTSVGLLNTREPTRIIRKYSLGPEGSYKLDSVTTITLNDDADKVLETCHLNVVDYEPISQAWPDISKEFDVSEECYVNNDRMRNGRDYAWLEFTFPLSSQDVSLLADHSEAIKSRLHRRFAYLFSPNVIRFPKAEVEFEDESLVFRLLALDYVPLEIRFERFESTSLVYLAESDHQDLAPNLRHCGELCRLHQCHLMTYCSMSHTCLYTTRTKMDTDVELISKSQCWTYADFFPDRAQMDSLQQVVARAQRLDYTPLALPKLSEEIEADPKANKKLLKDFQRDVFSLIKKERPGLEKMTLITTIDKRTIVLMPGGFEVEQDPLNDLDLFESSSITREAQLGQTFHDGLTMHRYKPEVFNMDNNPSAKLFTRLTFDQCALACLDGKCGSFSYCLGRMECLITNVNHTGLAQSNDLVEQDTDCVIMQRDFLRNFEPFEGVYRPQIYEAKAEARDASECALNCVSESSYACLAFDLCKDSTSSAATCFYQSERHATNFVKPQSITETGSNDTSTGCTHYSRSHLADFHRIENRELDDTFKEEFDMSKFTGRTVFECAEICLSRECSMFQFCFDTSDFRKGLQTCEILQSKLKTKSLEASTFDAGRYLKASSKCHLFSLRKDSVESQLKDLMLSSNGFHDKQLAEQRPAEQNDGFTFSSSLSLYFRVTCLSAGFVVLVCVAKQTEFVREKLDRVRIMIGV